MKKIVRIALGILFILASGPHFFSEVEMQIIPPFLPWRKAALYITGIFELLGGIGVLIPRFQRVAGWGLAALLVAILPANIYHAIKDTRSGGIMRMSLYHWLRTPLQGVVIWWALWSTRSEES